MGRIARKTFIQTTLRTFMTDVARGVEFLHLRKLVHMELSLDTVYVQVRSSRWIPYTCR
jgi:hypothetical protein